MTKAELEIIINILNNLKGEIKNIAQETITKGKKYNLDYIDKDIDLLREKLH